MIALAELVESQSAGLEVPDNFDEINRLYYARGWSDGLPIVPPTLDRVEQMLVYCDRPWQTPLACIPPRYGEATPFRLAVNAVMAGCSPQYFPLVMLAVEAMCADAFNLYAVQSTTHPCAPLVVVNGPIAEELKINSGSSALGPGAHANATIGRAIRLALINIGGGIPGKGDMTTYGSPTKYSYFTGENEVANPWEPLHVERGFPREATAVTVIAAEGPHNVSDHESTTGEGILKTIAGTVAITGSNNARNPLSEALILLCPEHAATIARHGYSKSAIKSYLFEHARLQLGQFSEENISRRFRVTFPERFAGAGLDALVPMVQNVDDFIVIVVGGPGKHSAFFPTFGYNRSVTAMLARRDGSLARSVEEFRQ